MIEYSSEKYTAQIDKKKEMTFSRFFDGVVDGNPLRSVGRVGFLIPSWQRRQRICIQHGLDLLLLSRDWASISLGRSSVSTGLLRTLVIPEFADLVRFPRHGFHDRRFHN